MIGITVLVCDVAEVILYLCDCGTMINISASVIAVKDLVMVALPAKVRMCNTNNTQMMNESF